MANITLYTNTSDNRYLNKNLIQLGSTLNCHFKDDTNKESPIITISPSAYNQNANYAYISDTDRYYYIEDVTYSNQRVILKLKVDVLMSFRNSILECSCDAIRSSTQFNKYFADDEVTTLQYDNYYLKKFSRSFSKDLNYILILAGG